MKFAILSALFFFTAATSALAHSCETECSADCADLIREYEMVVRSHHKFCNTPPTGACAGKLAVKRPYWTSAELAQACNGAPADCVLDLATTRPYWSPAELNTACAHQTINCAGRLAVLRPYWNPGQLSVACTKADGQCVVDLAKSKPYWAPSELNVACHDR